MTMAPGTALARGLDLPLPIDETVAEPVDVQALLPHRPPMLLVDRVLLCEAPARLVARRTIRDGEACLQGHFPGHPILPGVMLIEALAQAACLLALRATGASAGEGRALPALMGVRDASFLKPVRPGDTLDLEVVRVRSWGSFWQVRGTASIGTTPVARATLTATFLDAGFDRPAVA